MNEAVDYSGTASVIYGAGNTSSINSAGGT